MNVKKNEAAFASEIEEEFSIPLDMSDIISICKEYSNLGASIQNYMDTMMEIGLDKAVKENKINKQYISHIKSFLIAITNCQYFGEAVSQAKDCLTIINDYEQKNKSNTINLFLN